MRDNIIRFEGTTSELGRVNHAFPVLSLLSQYLKRHGALQNIEIGWHCHLTGLTALAAEAVVGSGAKLALSECNPKTTDQSAVEYMRSFGAKVHLGLGGPAKILRTRPHIISDTGLVLTSQYLTNPCFPLIGSCEITTAGILRLRSLPTMPLPVVNINDCQLKTLIENFHGVGDGVMEALSILTGKMWAGRKVAVAGYGRVGAGVAHYLRRAGAHVQVVEIDPVRCLIAHYDGFILAHLDEALSNSELLVTATGKKGLIGRREWLLAANGLLVVNVGHWSQEVEPDLLRQISETSYPNGIIEEFVVKDALSGQKSVFLATGGSPANVVLESGSPEPTLIHLTTEILCLEYLMLMQLKNNCLPKGEIPVPHEVEEQASLLALKALKLHADTCQLTQLEDKDRTC